MGTIAPFNYGLPPLGVYVVLEGYVFAAVDCHFPFVMCELP